MNTNSDSRHGYHTPMRLICQVRLSGLPAMEQEAAR
jgi:hypothetical protein